jgi:type I restriction enzyme S subunit
MKGYKHTELGWIPEDWEVEGLGSLIENLESGVSVNSIDDPIGQDDLCILKTSSVYNGSFLPLEKKKISPSEISRAKVNPKANSIIVSRMNTPDLVGECGYVDKTYENLFLPDRLWQTSFYVDIEIDARWLNYLLNTNEYRLKIKSSATGTSGSMKNISKATFLSIKVPKPGLLEQSNIANIVKCWDKSIETIIQLIAAKQQLKKGLMQQLLTGKKRLPGFKDDWHPVEFGKVFEFIKTESFSREDLTKEGNGNDVLYIHYGDIHALYNGDHLDIKAENQIPYLKADIGSKNGFAYLRDGDLIIADASEDYEGVGECTEVVNIGDKRVIGGLHTIVVRDKEGLTSPLFRGYILKNPIVALMLKKLAVGISVYGISKSSLMSLIIKLPSPKEQTAIANILLKAETDIQTLQGQLEMFKQQKKGLMQQLLTGKKRVKV